MTAALREFLRLESAGGAMVLGAAILALLAANSPWAHVYEALLETVASVRIGNFFIEKPLLLWINDGLMAVFFFLIGLELKREFLEGELSSPEKLTLPLVGAAGGIAAPALIYVFLNRSDAIALDAWAIPVATDIAFVLALLGAFGARVPLALKVFVLTLAIIDDLAAIAIIAMFYVADLSVTALLWGSAMFVAAVFANRMGVKRISIYALIGLLMWVAVLKSGVHATLAGILIALCIPLKGRNGGSPLRELEHELHVPVAFIVLPVFAFANAGLPIREMALDAILHPVAIGVAAGLVLGKSIGIVSFVGIASLAGLARLPREITWMQLLGVAFACGIGFTMSLFIAGLALEHGSGAYFNKARLGVLLGSALAALLGWLVLHFSLRRRRDS
ncbi:MAG: Na+/H+ antiporter NhaA [Gammaproteobacteria bacterium]|nr:Na+/H+ antiporter NhaA [Chromatiales bacterium]MYA30022.1 Na+/H+ antiporter NhaA [Gammaproteobacteria bacterium]MYE48858.1 Na+/H+ antiporter NhaA [Gammaproteobacteria bacterium]MYF67522.1 Na+/H+ antiporter NhaA [Gammaproteobacteria bacterium]MYK37373.1 Na+/H+ antiporter NhaA [Gammaproteobacteria bacterium]